MPFVLYAEDDENDAFFMKRAFAKLKRADALRIVPTGKQVVDYLSRAGEFADPAQHPRPTLLILDVKMPEMSGLEVLQWVRGQDEFSNLPVVMFTSSTQDSDLQHCRTHGANAFIVKPANADHLALLVTDLLDAVASSPKQLLPLPANRMRSS